MFMYLSASGDIIRLASGSTTSLTGSDFSSSYKGILFFVDRNAQTQSHTLGGGSALTLIGTIYAASTVANMTSAAGAVCAGCYQTIQLRGGSGSGTLIDGQIFASHLDVGGGGSITMKLTLTN